MTKFLEMEEKAERQFWEFEKTRMKLEQEQEERWRKDDSEREERQRREDRPFMANMMTLFMVMFSTMIGWKVLIMKEKMMNT
jgi:hypothetical protein